VKELDEKAVVYQSVFSRWGGSDLVNFWEFYRNSLGILWEFFGNSLGILFSLCYPLGNYEKTSCLKELKFCEVSEFQNLLKISAVYLIGK
jgi:hypothetical protein